MIQKAAATGNWWLAASLRQCSHSCITSGAEIFGETSNDASDSAPLQPRFDALLLLAFPKTKITFEREGISDHWWDSGKYNRAADGNWENCVRPQGAYSEGDWGVIVLGTVFLVSSIFFNKCLYISQYVAGYLLDRSCVWSTKQRADRYCMIVHYDTEKYQIFFHVLEGFYLLNIRELFAVLLLPCCGWGWGLKASLRIPGLILSHSRSHCRESTSGKALLWRLFGIRSDDRSS